MDRPDAMLINDFKRFAIALTLFSAVVVPSNAYADGSATRGKAVVEQWCRTCHQRVSAKPDSDLAPPYEDIVRRPGRDRAYFEKFLKEDHFPMTTFRLFDKEKADVVAYLMSLQKASQ